LISGVDRFNKYREEDPNRRIDLRNVDLRNVNLSHANLTRSNLRNVKLTSADLKRANLIKADLRRADLRRTKLTDADLTDANIDCISWPLWCGSKGVILDEDQTKQLLMHALDSREGQVPGLTQELLDWINSGKHIENGDFSELTLK